MVEDFKTTIVIPARINSKRLPNKILEKIGGEPMIKRVLEQCNKEFNKEQIIVCTDSNKVVKVSESCGYKTFITSNKCTSGTDRITSILPKVISYTWNNQEINDFNYSKLLEKTLIINVQSDQPFLDPKILLEIKNNFQKNKHEKIVITPIYPLASSDIENPNIVKVVINHRNQAIYFSRAPIPFNRDQEIKSWGNFINYWGHIGVYGYRADVLYQWHSLPDSKLEKIESLEQLKLVEAGIKINTIHTKNDFFSIDTFEQLEKAREIWNNIIGRRS